MLLCFPITVDAKDTLTPPDDFGDPIYENTYTNENGEDVTEKIYFVSDSGSPSIQIASDGAIMLASEKSGKGWFKKEETVKKLPDYTEWAQGYFTWGNGDVSVSSPSGGTTLPSSAKISDKKVTSGTGRWAGLFNKYAYVEHTYKLTNNYGWTEDNFVSITVYEDGGST